MIATTTANLNLRKGAGTTYDVIRVLDKGTQVSISGARLSNGWYKVTEGEDTGYVSGDYLTTPTEAPGAIVTRGQFMDALLAHLGKPYRWGGNGPANFDCSGYVGYVWRQLNLRQGDYTADAMYDNFRLGNWPAVNVAPEDADLGDLVFYGSGTNAGHVVFALSPGHVIGATGGGKGTTTDEIARKAGAAVRIDKASKVGSHGPKDRLAIYRMPLGLED
jgi:cell wall-associated NlpC family hydrolase